MWSTVPSKVEGVPVVAGGHEIVGVLGFAGGRTHLDHVEGHDTVGAPEPVEDLGIEGEPDPVEDLGIEGAPDQVEDLGIEGGRLSL